MSATFTLQYGTYTFPNQTFVILSHPMTVDTPVFEIRRKLGGVAENGYLRSKKFVIQGKVYGTDKDSVHNELNTMMRAVYNSGESAAFKYRDDRYVTALLAQDGLHANPEKGLYEYMYNVDLVLVSPRPFAESTTLRTVTGSRTNNSAIEALVNQGNMPTFPIFTFIAGATFSNDLAVTSQANSMLFAFTGTLVNGQTLVIDCDAGCVLMHVGATMVDAMCYFSGNLFFKLEDGGSNQVVIDSATLSYSIVSRDRYFI